MIGGVWRQGERVDALDLSERGVVGDRAWAVRTTAGRIGSGKDTRRFARLDGLLDLRARAVGGHVVVDLPGGTALDVDDPALADRVSEHVGQSVVLAAGEDLHDDGPVSLLGTASVRAAGAELGQEVDPGRFRANVVLHTDQPFAEDTWNGRRVRAGSAVLQVLMTSPRCVMVDAGTADLAAQPGLLRAVGRANRAELGVIASVLVPGRLSVGDVVTVPTA